MLVGSALLAYRPDRPVATIVPGSSSGPAVDAEGRVIPETQVVFELVFEERLRRARCRPGDPAIGTLSTTVLAGSGELSGSFDIELARCEDANTGKPLGWPSQPLILHGSFDRLPLDAALEELRAASESR